MNDIHLTPSIIVILWVLDPLLLRVMVADLSLDGSSWNTCKLILQGNYLLLNSIDLYWIEAVFWSVDPNWVCNLEICLIHTFTHVQNFYF